MGELIIDLNELVSKQVSERIRELEAQIESLSDRNRKLYMAQMELQGEVEKSKIPIELIGYLRSGFDAITDGEKDKNGYGNSKAQNQFLYIEQILLTLFNIKKEQNGWLSVRGEGKLMPYLAVNFYSHKKELINLLACIVPSRDTSFISSFVMPFDYSEAQVLSWISKPNSCTNSAYFGISSYWMDANCRADASMPWSLIMANPLMITDLVFATYIKEMKSKYKGSDFAQMFALPEHNSGISDKQIEELGECLIGLDGKTLNFYEIKSFIEKNILKLNAKTLEYLFSFISGENHYRALHWEKFPVEYQFRYLKSNKIDLTLKFLNDYSCKWTVEQKEEFLRLRFAA